MKRLAGMLFCNDKARDSYIWERCGERDREREREREREGREREK